MKLLVVVDMQNDFIDGALGTPEAVAIVPKVVEAVRNNNGIAFFTQDTHDDDYLDTQEGKKLPVAHCIENSEGWQITNELSEYANKLNTIKKPCFGSIKLAKRLRQFVNQDDEVVVMGLCTDICVIANAVLLKAFLPETKIVVDSSCCAGTTPENHRMALEIMKCLQIEVI